MYSNVDVGDREHGTNKKASWCGGCWWGRAGGYKEGPGGCRNVVVGHQMEFK